MHQNRTNRRVLQEIARNVFQTRLCNSLFYAFKVKWFENVSRENSSKDVGGNKLKKYKVIKDSYNTKKH